MTKETKTKTPPKVYPVIMQIGNFTVKRRDDHNICIYEKRMVRDKDDHNKYKYIQVVKGYYSDLGSALRRLLHHMTESATAMQLNSTSEVMATLLKAEKEIITAVKGIKV